MSYPVVLLPQPTYRLLTSTDVSTGWLLRRVEGPVLFLAELAKGNNRPLLSAGQIGSPAQRLPEGLSVNLLGQFELMHAGWQPVTDKAKELLRGPWHPPQATVPPTPADMCDTPRAAWDAYALDVAELSTCELATGRGKFAAHVCHAPNCWNYWHYEVRFCHETLGWAHAPGVYSENQLRKVGEAIRQAFQEAGLAQPVVAAGTPTPWSTAIFDTAVSV